MKNTRISGMFMVVQGTTVLKMSGMLTFFLVLVFSISGLLTSLNPQYRLMSTSVNEAATNINGKLLYQLMGWENHHFLTVDKTLTDTQNLGEVMFKLASNINLNDPRTLLGRELPGFYQFDGKIVVAGEGTKYTNMPIESAPPLEIMKAEKEASLQNLAGIDQQTGTKSPTAPSGQTTGGRQVVYVYFTHNRESYLPYLQGVTDPDSAYHSQINVTKIGDQLKTSLEERGIGTYIDKTDIQANLNKKGLSYDDSYKESRSVVQTAMTSNRDLQYLFDIHRDSQRKDTTTITINGQTYARLDFVIGGKNPNYEKNQKLAIELHNLLEKKYKGLSRGVLVKNFATSNSVYNQNLSDKAILIEFGGVDNTFEELNRSADALADVFSEYYWQAEKVNKDVEQGTNKQ
jgi:stage II sporulation protein P